MKSTQFWDGRKGDKELDVAKLRGKISERNIKYSYLAKEMGITPQTLNKKMRGVIRFNTDDVLVMCRVLDINDYAERGKIFLNNPSQK